MPELDENHAFTVYIVAGAPASGRLEDAFYAATSSGGMHLDFVRAAPSFVDAVGSATRDIEKAGGRVLKVERIEG
jgi:hypothetical protein